MAEAGITIQKAMEVPSAADATLPPSSPNKILQQQRAWRRKGSDAKRAGTVAGRALLVHKSQLRETLPEVRPTPRPARHNSLSAGSREDAAAGALDSWQLAERTCHESLLFLGAEFSLFVRSLHRLARTMPTRRCSGLSTFQQCDHGNMMTVRLKYGRSGRRSPQKRAQAPHRRVVTRGR